MQGIGGQVTAFLDSRDEVVSGGLAYSRTVGDGTVKCFAHLMLLT